MTETKAPRIVAFADEAGCRGPVREIEPANDHQISLICTIPIPAEHEESVRALVQPLYDRFCAAAPPGAVLHISEAFKPGNEAWGAVAAKVREELFALMHQQRMIAIYVARRAGVARKLHETSETMKQQAAASKTSNVKIVGANRPDDTRIEDEVMISLALMLDTFAEREGGRMIDIKFDELDAAVSKRYESALENTRNISRSADTIRGWDPETKNRVAGQIEFNASAPFELDSKFLGKITIAGKNHPLVFVADVVANSLWRHLSKLPSDAKLNVAASVAGWDADSLVWSKDADKGFDDY